MLEAAKLPRRLADYAIHAQDVRTLEADAAQQWTARFNARPVNEANLREIYGSAL
jgi:alcohol dehydrogenase class IV